MSYIVITKQDQYAQIATIECATVVEATEALLLAVKTNETVILAKKLDFDLNLTIRDLKEPENPVEDHRSIREAALEEAAKHEAKTDKRKSG